jgi:glycosyltransferase involved in cell wall biosynthesis
MNGASMKSPLVSIVIPTHNRPILAARAVESALAQSYRNIEIHVVDDGSDPPYVPGTASVKLTRHAVALGVCAARNAGLAAARGDLVTFLDDDDMLDPSMIEKSVTALNESTLAPPVAVLSGMRWVLDNGIETHITKPPRELKRGSKWFLEPIPADCSFSTHNTLVVPRQVITSIGGFDQNLWSYQHFDLFLRLNEVCSLIGLQEPLYIVRQHAGARLTKNIAIRAQSMDYAIRKNYAIFAGNRRKLAHLLSATGAAYLRAGNRWPAIWFTFRGIANYPMRTRSWYYFVAAVVGIKSSRFIKSILPARFIKGILPP